MPISPITEIIDELRCGRMVVIMDDEDRENEGDLLIAAQHARPEDINFMARHGRGLICLTLTPERCRQLRLTRMVSDNGARHHTNFTVSIEAAEGVTTGISAQDRAVTVQAAIRPDARPGDIVTPGHIFPLQSAPGGVLARAGHTEAGVDLARLAGLEPASVICEILNEDGTMARLPELTVFAREHGLKIGTIADLIRYRVENEATIQRVERFDLPTEFGVFQCVTYHDDIEDATHLALALGEIHRDRPTLVRVHVHASLLDLITGMHRAGHWCLRDAMARVMREGTGVVVILQHPESPGEMSARVALLRDGSRAGEGQRPPTQAMRTFGLGSQILADLGVGKMRVLSSPMKLPGMSGFGLEIVEYIEVDDEINAARHVAQSRR